MQRCRREGGDASVNSCIRACENTPQNARRAGHTQTPLPPSPRTMYAGVPACVLRVDRKVRSLNLAIPKSHTCAHVAG